MYNINFSSSKTQTSKRLSNEMVAWYKNSRFIRKLGDFQKSDQKDPDHWRTEDYTADYVLWKMLQHRQLDGFRFERQKHIMGNIVGFYCREAKLAIDLRHDRHNIRRREEQDSDKFLQKAGVRVLRFHRDVILERPNSVKNSILDELSEIKPVM